MVYCRGQGLALQHPRSSFFLGPGLGDQGRQDRQIKQNGKLSCPRSERDSWTAGKRTYLSNPYTQVAPLVYLIPSRLPGLCKVCSCPYHTKQRHAGTSNYLFFPLCLTEISIKLVGRGVESGIWNGPHNSYLLFSPLPNLSVPLFCYP